MHKRFLLIFFVGISWVAADSLTYDTTPLGDVDRPMILRTYVPDPGLDPAVFANHGKASKSPRYSPKSGKDTKGEYSMMKVIPAAIAVNHGPALSYVWDTTECRLLYAWQGGFLDLYPYWGTEGRGGRRSFDYGARLMGNLFYLAQPIKGGNAEAPKFLGYDLSEKECHLPIPRRQEEYTETIMPTSGLYAFEKTVNGNKVSLRGKLISKHQGFERNLKIKTVTARKAKRSLRPTGVWPVIRLMAPQGTVPASRGLLVPPAPSKEELR